ncbi:flavin reductase family protein [Streptomyces sp. SID13666]|uniref:flavin reductase family protein n=1 Tax=Streptomyces TaxID=1883 RepID=UPI001105B196|nr:MULTISPECIES: flavin reductase family protein [Streptomyces]MCZ4098574.1 flavin reductase family protein [Streptomyces sp. H39-C1]NEA56521.1 flavin reductase family protein [Streptomyces sp. SID13666]NEA72315.1 flavin reductase family protein [Streptomyces sp. SID13588]QNA77475.1 flavin reductase family protein [Streptomyces sp. So13.3]
MTVSAQSFRDVMACLAMPVAVVSTVDGTGGWHGATLGSVVSLSLDPPLVMFALGSGTSVHRPVCDSGRFCISILNAGQRATAERFAGEPAGRFAADIVSLDGVPAVGAAAGWLLCNRSDLVEAGDHTIVIGRVEHALRGPHSPAGPLLYHERRYHRLGVAAELHSLHSAGDVHQSSYADTPA